MNGYWRTLFTFWKDNDLTFAEAVIGGLPEAFYLAPSSTTGKYHPQDEIAAGGLALHSWRMAMLSQEMSRMSDDAGRLAKPLLLAAIVHDAFKPALSRADYWQHPLASAKHVLLTLPDLDIPWRYQCAYACASHEGRWTDPRTWAGLPQFSDGPATDYSDVRAAMHAADYVLSRRVTWDVMRNGKPYVKEGE
jgi:hypothetical protein